MRELAELPATGDADIAALASLFADPARCKVLLALDDGSALPASVLADEAGVSRSTASSHLGKLTEAGSSPCRRTGVTATTGWQAPRSVTCSSGSAGWPRRERVTSLREGTRAARLRSARTCYDHLAGWLGVAIMGSCWSATYWSAATDATTRGCTRRFTEQSRARRRLRAHVRGSPS